MKKFLILILVAAGLCAAPVMAGEDTTALGYVVLCNQTFTNVADAGFFAFTTATNPIDVAQYKGRGKFVFSSSGDLLDVAVTNPCQVVVQHASAKTGTFANVTGAAVSLSTTGVTGTTSVDVGGLRQYLRVGVKLLGTNDVKQAVTVWFVTPRPQD